MGLITTKSGNIVVIQGYFSTLAIIRKNVNFLHISDECHPIKPVYIPVSSNDSDAPAYAKMNTDGYVFFETDAPAGWYFVNISYPVNV